jgi:hypothetical protein
MDTTVPPGAANAAARDKFYVYRPMLDLIGKSEGTDRGRGYNETLGYGIMLDGRVTKGEGPTVDLVSMTREQIDKLQTRMLKDPDNSRLNSSAVGRFQEIRTTRRSIDKALGRSGKELFDASGQDEDACYLLGQRGIDKWLSGRLSLDSLIRNLAVEWASIPKPNGKGHYAGQGAGVSLSQVKAALAEVHRRHTESQPRIEVPLPVEKPVVADPGELEKPPAKSKTVWTWALAGIGSIVAAAGDAMGKMDWRVQMFIAAMIVAFAIYGIKRRFDLARAVKALKAELE